MTETVMTDAEREAQELARMDLPEHDVAVLVSVRSRGLDAADARDRAVLAVRQALAGSSGGMALPMPHRGHLVEGVRLPVLSVSELGRALTDGLFSLVLRKMR